MPLDFLVFYGSVRQNRQGIKAARFLVKSVERRGHTATLIDPMQLSIPMFEKMYKEYPKGQAPAPLETLAGQIRNADGFIIVSGEYNHSIPPALTSLMDHFLEEYFWKPSAIVCYSGGPFAGVRAAMQLRAFLAEIGASSIPSLYAIPKVQDAFSDDGTAIDVSHDKRIEKFLAELEWHAAALKNARATGVPG